MEVNLNILKQNIQELFLANSTYSSRQLLNTSSIEWFDRFCFFHYSFLLDVLRAFSVVPAAAAAAVVVVVVDDYTRRSEFIGDGSQIQF
jgi:hypothetical protein